MAPGEDRYSFDWGLGIAGACHRGEVRRIGPVSQEDPNCSLVAAGCGRGVVDGELRLRVVVVGLLVVSGTANMSGIEEQGLGQHNRLERAAGGLVEEGEQEQEPEPGAGIGIVGQEQGAAELEEGVGPSVETAAAVAVAAAAATQGHIHS